MKKKNNLPTVTVILPIYNEQQHLEQCIKSILFQTYKKIKIIVVNDGSTDDSLKILSKYKKIKVIHTRHNGPGYAKNLAIKETNDDILVFTDGDMILDKKYICNIIKPIINNNIATVTTGEYVQNIDNIWSNCWNINNNMPITNRIRENNNHNVFRAITRKKLINLGGFNPSKGYEDDKINKNNVKIVIVSDAICYHYNPDNLYDVLLSARWIGRSPKIKLSVRNIIRYSVINSLYISLNKIIRGAPFQFLIFKVTFDIGLMYGIIFKNNEKYYAK